MPDASVTERLQEAMGKLIRAAGLNPAPASVVFRKALSVLDGDKLPMVVVSVTGPTEFEAIGVGSTADKLLWGVKRGAGVALAFASGGGVANNPDLRSWHDAIWGAVNAATLQRAGATEANDVTPRAQPMFAPPTGSTIDWSVLDPWTIETLEERTR